MEFTEEDVVTLDKAVQVRADAGEMADESGFRKVLKEEINHILKAKQ